MIDELDVGGTEQQLLELVTRLDRRRYAPVVCCFRPGRVAREMEAAGVPLVTLRKRAKVDPALILALTRLMRRERVDLVQTYLFTANTWGRIAARLARVPVIVSSERNVDIWEARYKRLIGRWLDRWTHRTIANSDAVKEYLVARGLAAGKLAVIPNGVDLARFEALPSVEATRAELGVPQPCPLVAFLARLEPQKDPATFLQAAARVAERAPSARFLVIGGGTLEGVLRREARALGLGSRVVFTGPRDDAPRLLAASDVLVLTSLKEGMSNAIMEAMAAGRPVVATQVGGNAQLVEDGRTGFLVPPRDPEATARAICRVLEAPDLARSLGERARRRVAERFSVEAMVQATDRLYGELLASAGRAARPRRAGADAREASGLAFWRPWLPTAPVVTGTRGASGEAGERPARVALVVSEFPRYVDAYLLREIRGLAARGIRFRILALRRFQGRTIHAEARPFLADTVEVPFLLSRRVLATQAAALVRAPGPYLRSLGALLAGGWRRPHALLKALAVFPKSVYFARLVVAEGIRHVHANWATYPATSAWVISRLAGVPWSFAGHASDIYLDTTLLADKIRSARFVVTCTRHNRDHLVRLAGPWAAEKVVVSYHGVDLARFRPVRRATTEEFRILAVGSLVACKGFPDLVEACRLLGSRGLAYCCTVVGDGPERGRLERQIREADLGDRVRLTGYLTQEELLPLYQGADVVVLPALSAAHFGIPNVLLEALAVETPVICTPLPSLGEVMEHGREGLFVPEGAPDALADALEALARDPDRRRTMGRAGRRMIEARFDAARNVSVLASLLEAACGGPGPTLAPAGETVPAGV